MWCGVLTTKVDLSEYWSKNQIELNIKQALISDMEY